MSLIDDFFLYEEKRFRLYNHYKNKHPLFHFEEKDE